MPIPEELREVHDLLLRREREQRTGRREEPSVDSLSANIREKAKERPSRH